MRPLSFLKRRAVYVARILWWLILKRAPIIVCISEAVARDTRLVFRRASDTTPVIYNAVEPDENPDHRYKKSASPFKLLLVGRLHKEKRPELIVPLMQEVLKREKDVIALVAGMVKVDQCWKSSLIGQA
jgi:glycosyltransferase involved in cell wall biosynthesis